MHKDNGRIFEIVYEFFAPFLQDELDLTTSQKNGILNFPPEKQLQLLYSHTMQSSLQVKI